MRRYVLICSLLILCAQKAGGRTWRVPAEAPTIQAGIDAAAPGDVILVSCGTYFEHALTMKPGITLSSETGLPDCVIIDAQQKNRVMACDGTGGATLIEGITFTAGDALGLAPAPSGGGLYCVNASLTISHCRFVANAATSGGGLFCLGSSPVISDCVFADNSAKDGAGLFCFQGSAPAVTDCLFEGNVASGAGSGGGGLYCDQSDPTVTGCVFLDNAAGKGGGLYCFDSMCSLGNCTFTGNSGFEGGGGVYGYNSSPQLQNCIIAFNEAGGALRCWFERRPALSSCDIFGNYGGDWVDCIADQLGANGNFMADPGFCDASAGDLTVCADSWCLPGTLPNGTSHGLVGKYGAGCVACNPLLREPVSWGQIKIRYK